MGQQNLNEFFLFLRKIVRVRRGKLGCWLVGHDSTIYPTVTYQGRSVSLSRLSYELFYGKKLRNLFACHHCDVRNCIRPDHIFAGTHIDNIKDAMSKGRVFNINIKTKKRKLTFCGDFGHGY